MAKRKVSNPLALAVLGLLSERPMHPYEMSATLRERSKESSIKLNYGSLYSVVESLVRHGLIEVHETIREGRRPERTVYRVTEAGRSEFIEWLTELVEIPVKEYTQFEAALSLLAGLPPEEVLRLLKHRLAKLRIAAIGDDAVAAEFTRVGFPRLFGIEGEYVQALRKAEIAFVEALVNDIADGSFEHLDLWRAAHTGDGPPTEQDWMKGVSFGIGKPD